MYTCSNVRLLLGDELVDFVDIARQGIARLTQLFQVLLHLLGGLGRVILGQGVMQGKLDELHHRLADRQAQTGADHQPYYRFEEAGPQLFEVFPEGHRAFLEKIVVGRSLTHEEAWPGVWREPFIIPCCDRSCNQRAEKREPRMNTDETRIRGGKPILYLGAAEAIVNPKCKRAL